MNQNLGTYKGGLYENIVSEALIKSGAGCFIINGRIQLRKRISSCGQRIH